ncbi:transcription elongation factor GreA [Hydrogenimonas sp.]|uniref:transcription elongation factor GreA n=1 Tax=Hydrogenimonas sp. TaxID=2231112 RepID=UPI00261F0359|nr:transcription elongation factor GreA [Hydrogenimonas sp.]
MQKEPMTEYGYKKLHDELEYLKSTARPAVAKEIEKARELGDLKENAEYHAAKEKQGLMEARIAELEDILGRAQVVDPAALEHKRVSFGSTVTLIDLDTDEEVTYTIVGASEANPDKGLISYHSPLARQLIGKEPGDDVRMRLPGGEKEYEIEQVCYQDICFGV